MVATLLLMVHPTVFLLRDLRLINPVCQTRWGLFMLYCCTYFGFINLFYGAMWTTRGFEALRKAAQTASDDGYCCKRV